ncbi:MAG TPA: ABC transporter permease [Proteobacteria bacterium]|nr:putative osmoprotectant uptake system permease protein YehY [bacterium BMS3Abin14]HDL54014.1 ABC transporter permease [Pseudomonadota bacterium]
MAWVVFLFWALLLLASSLNFPERTCVVLSGVLSGSLLPVLLSVAGRYAAEVEAHSGPIARVSMSAAFWTALFALAMVIADSYQRSEARTRIFILLIIMASGAAVIALFASGSLDHLSIMKEFANRKDRFFLELKTHLVIAGSSVGIALLIGIPLGALAHRVGRFRAPTFFTLNTLQTVPSLALFGILVPILAALTHRFPALHGMGIRGIGATPAIIALTIYSLLPIARNTFTGFLAVDPAVVDAGRGMGMTRIQMLLQVEVPIASPIILSGVRIALVQAVGLTAVAALIGAGGFGVFIFQGLGQAATDLILLGAVPTILIAVAADVAMNGIIAIASPKGMR